MATFHLHHVQIEHDRASNAGQVYTQLAEQDRVIDFHLARITRLQMLLNLEEARLIQSRQEQRKLRSSLGMEAFSGDDV